MLKLADEKKPDLVDIDLVRNYLRSLEVADRKGGPAIPPGELEPIVKPTVAVAEPEPGFPPTGLEPRSPEEVAREYLEAEHAKIPSRQIQRGPVLPTISEAPEKSLSQRILEQITPFKATRVEQIAQAQNVRAIAKQTGQPISVVRENYPELMNEVMKRQGPTTLQLIEYGILPHIAFGLSHHAARTLLGLATFGGVAEVVNAAVSLINDEDYQFLAGKGASELLPEESSQLFRETVDIAEFIAIGLAAHGVYKRAPKVTEKLTKDIFTEFKAPKRIIIPARKVASIFRTGEEISPEELDLIKSLNLDGHQYRMAVKQGLDIKIPAEKISTIVDKPYWIKLKSIFGRGPAERITRVERAGEQIIDRAPAGELPPPRSVEGSYVRQIWEKKNLEAQAAAAGEAAKAEKPVEAAPKPEPGAEVPEGGIEARPEPIGGFEVEVEGKKVPVDYRYQWGEKGWEDRPIDDQELWGRMMGDVAEVEKEVRPQIEALEGDLEALKGTRDKVSRERKKEIKADISRLKARYDALDEYYHETVMDFQEKIIDEAIEKAKKRGVPEDRIDAFAEDFGFEISGERPYIEYNYDKTYNQIFEETVVEHIPSAEKYKEIETEIAKLGKGKKPDERGLKNLREELEFHRQAVGEEPVKPEVPKAEKEIKDKGQWKLTLDEYIKKYGRKGQDPGVQRAFFALNHKKWIKKALSEGKPVPAEVLKDYPDLVKEKPAEKPPEIKPEEGKRIPVEFKGETFYIERIYRQGWKGGEDIYLVDSEGKPLSRIKGEKSVRWSPPKGIKSDKGLFESAQKFLQTTKPSVSPKVEKPFEEPEVEREERLEREAEHKKISKMTEDEYIVYRLRKSADLLYKQDKPAFETRYRKMADSWEKNEGDARKVILKTNRDLIDGIKSNYQTIIKERKAAEKPEKKPVEVPEGYKPAIGYGFKKIEGELTLKEQKEYLIKKIDEAIKTADPAEEDSYYVAGKKLISWPEYTEENKKKYGTITIEVPGDGRFVVLNTKPNLEHFKKAARGFPTAKWKITKPGRKPEKVPSPMGVRMKGVEYYNPFRPRKRKIVMAGKDERQFYVKGFYTEGRYMVKVDKKPESKTDYVETDKDFENSVVNITKAAEKAIPAEMVAETFPMRDLDVEDIAERRHEKVQPRIHAVTENGEHYIYQAHYVDAVLTEHPNSKVSILPQKEKDTRAVVGTLFFKKSGEVVGVVTPMDPKGEGPPSGKLEDLHEVIQEGYAELTKGEKAEAEKLRKAKMTDEELAEDLIKRIKEEPEVGEFTIEQRAVIGTHVAELGSIKKVAEYYPGKGEADTFARERARELFGKKEFKKKIEETREKIEQWAKANIEAAGEADVVKLQSLQRVDEYYIVSRDPSQKDKWRATRFAKLGDMAEPQPYGHDTFRTRDNAISSLSGNSTPEGPPIGSSEEYKVVETKAAKKPAVEKETAAELADKMSPTLMRKVDEDVVAIGSIEKVNAKYTDTSLYSDYARAKARELFGEEAAKKAEEYEEEHEARQEEKREKLLERAEEAERQADAYDKSSNKITRHIPFGQPILVGHYSEARHRRDLARVQGYTDKAVALREKARELRERAERIGTGREGISSDDPGAIRKLKEKIEGLEAEREAIKAANKAIRQGTPLDKIPELTPKLRRDLEQSRNLNLAGKGGTFPPWKLQNLGQNIQSVKKRIAQLERKAERAEEPGEAFKREGANYKIIENLADNRFHLTFDEKPPKEVTRHLRSEAWLWSPTRKAWVRKITSNARWSAERVSNWLDENYKPGEAKEPESYHDIERRRSIAEIEKKEHKTRGDEITLFRLKGELEADPSKWSVGDGVGYYAGTATPTKRGSQINRGFQIVRINASQKLAMVRQVADTGITISGGADRLEDRGVHIADLVRDRNYDAPAAPSGLADTGGYADIGGYEEPPGAEPGPSAMDLPEIVELAKQLMKGKLPKIKKRLRGFGVIGRFRGIGKGEIELKAGIFKDQLQGAKVLAHEIGHLVDWLPKKTMARGNILGRIASLKNYLKHYLENRPGAAGPLTDKDRVRLKKEARKLIKKEAGELIDEEIRKELPITPDDILAIWREATTEITKEQNPELYEYITKLSNAEKASIVKEAMKGTVPHRLKRFAKIVMEKTGRKIKAEPSEKAIYDKYKELIRKEIEKRRLFERDKIMNELIDFTHEWKPFDPNINPNYTRYRYSSKELYADALSAIITNPGYMRKKCPMFYEGFFNYLDRKPEVKELFELIQDEIKSGANQRNLVIRTRQGFLKREEELKSLLQRTRNWLTLDALGTWFIDQNFAISRKVWKVGESNIPENFNPIYKLEEWRHSGTEAEGYLVDFNANVLEPLKEAGLTHIDLGEYLMHWRIATERAEFANPLGWTPERSKQRIKEMDKTFGPILKKVKDSFRNLREDWFLSKVEDAKMYGPELTKTIMESEHYVTFDIIGHLEKSYGRPASSHIFRQVGTFTETGNPLTATVIKDILVMRSINKNIAAKAVVDLFSKHFPKEIKPADTRWNGRFHAIQESASPDTKLMVVMKEGKLKGYYLPKFVAESFRQNPNEANVIARLLRISFVPFRMLFTELNPGFWTFNLGRDYKAAAKQLPKLKYSTFLKYWFKGIPPAFKGAFGKPDEITKIALKNKSLLSVASYHWDAPEDLELERLLKRYGITKSYWNMKVAKPITIFIDGMRNAARAMERIPKLGGYLYLKEKFPKMPAEKVAHLVRARAGSPDFMRTGTGAPFYNYILPFSNAMKEGTRSAFEAATNNFGEYLWKTIKYNILWKLFTRACLLGLVGWQLKRIYEGISDYDLANYNCYPIGLTETGKSVYIRIPQDETGRIIGGTFWMMTEKEHPKAFQSIFDYGAGQVPSLHPMITAAWAATEYMSGRNPYDHFRSRPIIDKDVFLAGGKRSHKAFAKWTSNQFGGGIIHRFKHDGIREVQTDLERFLNQPIASNVVGRFVKVSDYGIRQKLNEELRKVASMAAEERLLLNEALVKMLEGKADEITNEEIIAMAKHADSIPYYTRKALAYKFGNVYMEKFITARSNEQKAIILRQMIANMPYAQKVNTAQMLDSMVEEIRNRIKK